MTGQDRCLQVVVFRGGQLVTRIISSSKCINDNHWHWKQIKRIEINGKITIFIGGKHKLADNGWV